MGQAAQIINQVLPIIFLLCMGFWIRHKNFLGAAAIQEFQKIVVNVALPAVLFISFLKVEFTPSYFIIFGLIFLLCVFLFILGLIVGKLFRVPYSYFPYLTTGFEYGMLGISLFGAAYGLENLGYIAVVDLGHEVFIWFLFLPLLLVKRDGVQKPTELFRSFLSAPVVIAILASLFINGIGAVNLLYQLPVTGALMATFELLGNLTVPLILIIVGYGIRINRTGMGNAFLVVAMRLGLLIPLALLLNVCLLRGLLQLDPYFEAALFALLVLPPPFIVPLYQRADIGENEKQYINNVLTLHTIASVSVFLVYFLLNPLVL